RIGVCPGPGGVVETTGADGHRRTDPPAFRDEDVDPSKSYGQIEMDSGRCRLDLAEVECSTGEEIEDLAPVERGGGGDQMDALEDRNQIHFFGGWFRLRLE